MEDVEAGRTIAESELFLGEERKKDGDRRSHFSVSMVEIGRLSETLFPSQLSPLLYDYTNKNKNKKKTHNQCT